MDDDYVRYTCGTNTRNLERELKAARRIIMRMQDTIEKLTKELNEVRWAYIQTCVEYEGLKSERLRQLYYGEEE